MVFFTKNPNLKKNYFFWGGGGGGGGGGGVDGRTDEQAQTNLPLQLLRSCGITMHICTNYGPNKLNL